MVDTEWKCFGNGFILTTSELICSELYKHTSSLFRSACLENISCTWDSRWLKLISVSLNTELSFNQIFNAADPLITCVSVLIPCLVYYFFPYVLSPVAEYNCFGKKKNSKQDTWCRPYLPKGKAVWTHSNKKMLENMCKIH